LHNEGPACQRALSIIRCLRDRQGGTSWDALRSVLNDTPRPALLPKIRPILPQVAREMTIETLREAVLPNGTVDLGRVPTFRQIKNYRGTMAGMSLKTRVTGLENHHLVPKEVARLLGLSTSGLDDSPACLLPRTELRKGNGEGAESFHAVLRGRIAMLGLEPSNERVIAALLLSHTEIGIADARPVVEAWLRGDGVWQE
jgi:hypothetical protein